MEYKYQIELEGRETVSPAAKRATAALKKFNKNLKTTRYSTQGVLEPAKKYDDTLKGIADRTHSYSEAEKQLGATQRQKEKILGDVMEKQNQVMKSYTQYGKLQQRQSKKMRKSLETVAQGYKLSTTQSDKFVTSVRKNSKVSDTVAKNTKKSFDQISDSISSTTTAQQKYSSSLRESSKSTKTYAKGLSVVSSQNKQFNSSVEKGSKISSSFNNQLKESTSKQGKYTQSLKSTRKLTNSLSSATNTLSSDYDNINTSLEKRRRGIRGLTGALKNKIQVAKQATKSTKSQGQAERYINTLLGVSDKEYDKISKQVGFYKLQTKAANDLATRGIKAVNSQLTEEIGIRAKNIKQIRRIGTEASTQAKVHNDAILSMNEGLKKYGTKMGRLRDKLDKGAKAVHKLGMGFLTLLGPVFLVGAAFRTVGQAVSWAFDPFIKFEDALYELRKTADLSIKQMDEIGKKITELSTKVPIAANELANMAAVAGRLGIKGTNNIMEFTKTISKMSTATTLSAENAAESLAKIRTAFGLPISAIENLGSVINALENTTASTVEEVTKGMRKIGASAKQIGVATDEAAAFAATLISSGMEASRAGPFSQDTQILTDKGWKLIKDLKIGDLLYTLNPDTNAIEIHPNENLVENEWSGKDIIHIKSKTIDLKVTPEHNLWVQPLHNNNYKAIPAKDILPRKIVRFKRSGIWNGEEKNYFRVPSLEYNGEDKIIPSKLFIQLIGLFLAEGTIHDDQIEISQNIDSNQWHKMQEVFDKLKECGFNYHIQKDKRRYGKARKLVISSKQLATYFKNLDLDHKSYNKYIPPIFKNLKSNLLQELIYYFYLGDGTKDSRYPNTKRCKLTSSSEKLIDDFQEISLKAGYVGIKSRDKKQWSFVSIKGNKKLSLARPSFILNLQTGSNKLNPQINTNGQNQISVEKYKGKVYCPTVKNHIVYVRRNGRPVWCRQTRIRRMFVELAQKSGEVMKFMEEDAQEWARTLRENPTKAIMMYIEKLSQLESKTKRTAIAHKHFGQVAGFAISTLAENYSALRENLKTTNEQMKWGTSLQREFSIAIDKTSAKLKILENRSKAARREIGEGFTPTLINFKTAWIRLEEEIGDAITLLQKIRGESQKSTTTTGQYIKEINRLGKEIGTLPGYFEGYLSYLGVGTQSLRAFGQAFKDFLTLNPQGVFKNLAKSNYIFSKASEEMTKSSKDFTKILGIENKLYQASNVTLKNSIDHLKQEGDMRDSTATTIKNYEDYLEKEPEIRTNIINTVKDESERKRELNKLDMLEANLKMNVVNAVIKEYEAKDTLTNKEFKNYQSLKKIYQDEIDLGKRKLDFWDKEKKVREAQLALRDKDSTTYKNVVHTIKQVNKERGNEVEIGKSGIQVYQQLLQSGYDLINIGGKMRIVDEKLGEQWSKGSDSLKERNRFYKEYLGTTKTGINQFENLIRAQIKLNDLEDELTKNTKELSKSTRDLYGNAEDLLGTYSSMYDTWDHVLDIEKEAKGVTKKVIGTYSGQVDTIKSLVNKSINLSEANKDVAASEKITTAAIMARNLAEKLHQRAMTATSDKEREAYKKAFDWLSSNLSLIRKSTFGVGKLKDQWDSTVGTVRKSLYGILGLPKEITKEGAKGITNIKDLFSTVEQEMSKLPQDISSSVTQSFKPLPKMMSEAVRRGISTLPESIGEAYNKVENIKSKISSVKLPKGLKDFSSSSNWQDIFTQVTNITDKIKTIKPKSVTMNLNEGNFLSQWDDVTKKMEENKISLDVDVTGKGADLLAYLKQGGTLNLEAGGGGIAPPSKQTGGSIPETGIYKLHKGEEVIPKKEVEGKEVNVTVNFPNMIINRELDINKIRSKIVEVINTELSRKLRR